MKTKELKYVITHELLFISSLGTTDINLNMRCTSQKIFYGGFGRHLLNIFCHPCMCINFNANSIVTSYHEADVSTVLDL
jgi:hypothetical protein